MKSRWLPFALVGTGAMLAAATVVQIAIRASEPAPLTTSFAAGVATSAPFALALVVGGYWLTRDPVPEDYYPHIAVGTLAGTVFLVVFLGPLGVSFFDSPVKRAEIVRWAATVGAGGGFLISYLYIRSIEREASAERAMVRAEEAEQRQELLAYLNALLRHEVLNTATAVKGHAKLVEDAAEVDAVRERVQVIQRQTDELTRVIDDVQIFLDAAENGAADDFEPVDLATVVREELRNLRDRHGPVETETDLPERLYVPADGLVWRLFSNLFENAVEHNESATPRVSVTATRADGVATVRVRDNGRGFPEDRPDDVFEPSVNLKATHGLGLAIVGRLADRYGGNAELTETGADGSEVTVTLPLADELPGDARQSVEPQPADQ